MPQSIHSVIRSHGHSQFNWLGFLREDALIRIGQYLKGTRDKGLVLTPTSSVLNVEAYPDADFGGLYGLEHPTDSACAKRQGIWFG